MKHDCWFCGEEGKVEQNTTAGVIWICGCHECCELFSKSFIRRSVTVWSEFGDFKRTPEGKLVRLKKDGED